MKRVGGAIPNEDQLMNLNMEANRACCDTPVPTLTIKQGMDDRTRGESG